ncbi:Nn.00g019690.m01.CDS01 [Neocucurbitaria sp. VM-36]
MRITLYVIHLALPGFALSDAFNVSLDVFLRDLPPSRFNFSQLLPGSTNIQAVPDAQQAWSDDVIPTPASDYLWCKAVSKGTTFLNAMSYSDIDAGQVFMPPRPSARSLWSLDHLKPWGWNIYENYGPEWCNWESNGHWGIANFIRSKGISDKCVTEGGLWNSLIVVHGDTSDVEVDDQTYRGPDGRVRRPYKVTGAEYNIGVNGKQGGIIAFKRYGPADRAKKMVPPVPEDQFPPLKSSSDIIWALWEKLLLPDAHLRDQGNINFFISLSIENAETIQILKRALSQVNSDLTRAGRTFDMITEEGKAILGSPNAIAFAYFLIQHKAELGNKIIDSVHVMECETSHKSPCLFFSVKGYADHRKPPGKALSPQAKDAAERNEEPVRANQERNLVRVHTMCRDQTYG